MKFALNLAALERNGLSFGAHDVRCLLLEQLEGAKG